MTTMESTVPTLAAKAKTVAVAHRTLQKTSTSVYKALGQNVLPRRLGTRFGLLSVGFERGQVKICMHAKYCLVQGISTRKCIAVFLDQFIQKNDENYKAVEDPECMSMKSGYYKSENPRYGCKEDKSYIPLTATLAYNSNTRAPDSTSSFPKSTSHHLPSPDHTLGKSFSSLVKTAPVGLVKSERLHNINTKMRRWAADHPGPNDEHDPIVGSRFTNLAHIDDRDIHIDINQNDNDYANSNYCALMPVASMINHERNFVPNATAGIYRLERSRDTDAPIIAWTAEGHKVIINRQVVDTVGIGISRAVICSSLCNGNVTITVLPAARNDKPIGFSLVRLALLVCLATVVTFAVINYLHGVSLPRLISEYLANNSHSFDVVSLTNTMANSPFFTPEEVAFSFLVLLSIAVLIDLGISMIIP
ncbi:hypothetical protein K435DRAFT_797332 [Dendrothele bispora CBS 962.96]|uniref:Uncharacterized protein n=1 Tax=Dendrothele bispora (strain CBS 962.96) TaxID=1314807 RepID=A0A4S8M408_DENBC|nr:hypothetical protein K435DRAFT_797332 [Dendrothele bispora CBS 962.96]